MIGKYWANKPWSVPYCFNSYVFFVNFYSGHLVSFVDLINIETIMGKLDMG